LDISAFFFLFGTVRLRATQDISLLSFAAQSFSIGIFKPAVRSLQAQDYLRSRVFFFCLSAEHLASRMSVFFW